MWISMKLLERRICFNKIEIVKFSDDRVDRMDRSRMPVVSQRMVWLHQRTPLQMCFALTHYNIALKRIARHCSGNVFRINTRDIALKLQWKVTGEEISWLSPLIPSTIAISPTIAPLPLLHGMSSPLTAGYFDHFELTYMCTSDNWCLKGRKDTECWLDVCLFSSWADSGGMQRAMSRLASTSKYDLFWPMPLAPPYFQLGNQLQIHVQCSTAPHSLVAAGGQRPGIAMVWLTGRLQMLPSPLHLLHFHLLLLLLHLHSLLLHLHLLHLHLWLKLPSKDWSLRTKGIFCQSVAVHSVGLDWNVLRKSTCVVTNCPGTRCFLWISFDQQLQQTLDFLQVCNWSPSNMDNCSSSYKPTFRCHWLSNVILLSRPHPPVYCSFLE